MMSHKLESTTPAASLAVWLLGACYAPTLDATGRSDTTSTDIEATDDSGSMGNDHTSTTGGTGGGSDSDTGDDPGGGDACVDSSMPDRCGDVCVDTQSDPSHCGSCDNDCETDEVCSEGECALDCGPGITNCSGACIDTQNNPDHCGACERSCGGGFTCQSASCVDQRQWGVPQLIETSDDSTGDPKVVVDMEGDAFSVWRQGEGGDTWTNRYDSTTNRWGTAALLGTGSVSNSNIGLDIGADGHLFATWIQNSDTNDNVVASRYDLATTTWGTPKLLEYVEATPSWPQISVDDGGNAFAIWKQADGLWVNRYDAQKGSWDSAEDLETELGTPVGHLAVANDGDAFVVWRKDDGMRHNAWVARYDATDGEWSDATLLETDDGRAWSPHVAVDDNSNAFAVWHQDDGDRTNVWFRRYDVQGNVWNQPHLLEMDDTGDATSPQVAFDANGNAIAIWNQHDDIWAIRYDAIADDWGAPQAVGTEKGLVSDHRIAFDSSGNAVTVWSLWDGDPANIWSNRYDATSDTWSTAELIEQDSGAIGGPDIAVDRNGNAVVVWWQSDGTRPNIWANHLRP